MRNKKILYLEPYICLFVSTRKGLIFNYLNQEHIEYANGTTGYELIKILNNSHYTKEVSLTEERDPDVNEFISKIRKFFMGDLVKGKSAELPMILYPKIKIQQETRFRLTNKYDSLDTGKCLNSIDLYLNNIGGINSEYNPFFSDTSTQVSLSDNMVSNLFNQDANQFSNHVFH
jgi:hypothetical protein